MIALQSSRRAWACASLFSMAVGSGLSGAGAQPAAGPSGPRSGRALALAICTPCHVVAPDQEFRPVFTGPPRPPTFQAVADRPKTTEESLRRFLSTTHSTMQLPVHMANPELTEEQTAKIVAFILSLKDKH